MSEIKKMKILKNEKVPTRGWSKIEKIIDGMDFDDCAEFDTEQEAQAFYSAAKRLVYRKNSEFDVVKRRKRVWKVAKESNDEA